MRGERQASCNLAELAIGLLVPGAGGGYEIPPTAVEVLGTELERAAELDAHRSIFDLLRLVRVLQTRGSGAAASSIVTLFRSSRRALMFLSDRSRRASSQAAEVEHALGRPFASESAPMSGTAAPPGSFKLHTLLDPGARDRRRSRRSARARPR